MQTYRLTTDPARKSLRRQLKKQRRDERHQWRQNWKNINNILGVN